MKGQIRQICRVSLSKIPTTEFENPTKLGKIGTLGSPAFHHLRNLFLKSLFVGTPDP